VTAPKPTGANMRFVWLDLETTGTDERADRPLAAGVVVTNGLLEPLAIDEVVIWQPESVLERMSPFVRDMHVRSGLLPKVRESKTTQAAAARRIAAVIGEHVEVGAGILAGNSIHFDRRFVVEHLLEVETFLGYRMLDVSVFKVIASAFGIEIPFPSKESAAHTPIADLSNSLRELNLAIENLFGARPEFTRAQIRADALRQTLEAFGTPNVTATVPKAPPIPASFEIVERVNHPINHSIRCIADTGANPCVCDRQK
jgi:oligoribonuclease